MKLILRLFVFLFSSTLIAQIPSNAWIEFSQSYYRFPISEKGIYRITYQDLVNANVQLSSLNPQNLQIFARGNEVPLYINGEVDGTFNTTDYIEFFAEGNDGWYDSTLYNGLENQPNPYYSLINDTINYFLTWNTSTANLRYKEETAIDFSNYFKASFVWKERIEFYNSSYYDGEILTGGVTDPEYTPTEGWLDGALTLGSKKNKSLFTPNRYSSGPFVEFETKIIGASNWSLVNNGDHHVRISIRNKQFDRVFEGYESITIKESFSPTEIIGGNNTVTLESIDDRNSEVDRTALAYIKATYPQTLNFSNESYYEFLLDDASNQNAQYLEVLLFRGGSNPILYDLDNRKKIRVVETLSNYKTIIPNGKGRKRCILLAESEIKKTGSIEKVGENGSFTNYLDKISDTTFLIITHGDLTSASSFYASYRESKGLNSFFIDIQELYEQYAYGINKHPYAIKNFIQDIATNGSFPLSHVFLIGKSVSAKDHRKSTNGYIRNLVPTMGNPAADNLLLAGIGNSFLEPYAPLGRLSAKNNSDVSLYLDKVIEYEAAPPAKWMKRALHFAGGKSTFETSRHENFLNGYARDFESVPLGGSTQLFRKSTSSPFQVTLSDSIRTLINEGVSLLTFFGHSTANGGFDISIDTPDKLKNQGRYHVLFANSCYAGNTHQNGSISTSEQYVLERNKGAIAFIASGNLGLSSYLNQYSSSFYENLTNQNYGKSLAEIMQLTVRNLQTPNLNTLLKSVCLEMTLQGDPAIVLNAQPKVDYVVEKENISTYPSEVTTDLESFKIRVRIDNIGRANEDSVLLELSRTFPTNSRNDTNIIRSVAAIDYEGFVEFSFPINSFSDIGFNSFTFLIDPLNTIDELSEFNNRVDFEVLIRSGEIIPVYPYNYAIVGEQSPTLRASTAFAFEEEKVYRFEVDQNAAFSSSLKPAIEIPSAGGVIEWQPPSLGNMADSSVYFWRVSKVPEAGEDFNWKSSSFQYLRGESGWAQDDFDQFDQSDYLFINQNKTSQQFEFTDNVKELSVSTVGSPSNEELDQILYAVDADIRERKSCFTRPAFLVAVLDSLTLESWETPYKNQNAQNDFGQNNVDRWCFPNRDRAERVFYFAATDSLKMIAMRDFLNNSIPKGSYVVAYNYLNINYSLINDLDSSILKAFDNLGSSIFSNIQNDIPFIFSVKKGDLSSVVEKKGNSSTEKISIKRILRANATFGEQKSSIIGPSAAYKRFTYHFNSLESNSDDKLEVNLIGIDPNGNESILLNSDKMSLDTSFAGLIDGKLYQRLKMSYRTEDLQKQTPAQLDRWQVSYLELPDAALAPNTLFSKNKDSLQQGENLEVSIAVKNNSSTILDSFFVSIKLIDSRQNLVNISTNKLDRIPGDSELIFQFSIPTLNFIGKNTVLIELNPSKEQAEQHYFNNLGQFDFYVMSDRINPLLDITFDGRHILNGEIISANPEIMVSLRDDNEFLALDDTSAFNLFITDPNGVRRQLNYDGSIANNELEFMPASLPENIARVRYSPQLIEDGIYKLGVQARDKSGNESGINDYQVEFEVVNRSTVSHLLNYPNPFSTSTQFVFTLTGSEVPDKILIQIMTITGKVVREIDQFELGPIHIGNNISLFKWDGKDEFGDQLANGVYLYRVKMKLNERSIEHRSTKADQYFTKDFGKMYLLR